MKHEGLFSKILDGRQATMHIALSLLGSSRIQKALRSRILKIVLLKMPRPPKLK